MCLVEVSPGPPKPQASCAMPAMYVLAFSSRSEGMVLIVFLSFE